VFFNDVYVFFINVVMVSVNFQITIRSYRLASDDQKRQIEIVLHSYLWVAMLFGFVFLYCNDYDTVIAAYGWMCCGFNMTVFVPPIFVMKRVFETKDASTISAPFAVVGTFCTFFWAFYGILINQYSIVWPNVFGLVLCVVQTLVTFLYPGPKAEGKGPGTGTGTAVYSDVSLTPNTSLKALLSAADGSPSPSPVPVLVEPVTVTEGSMLVKRAVFDLENEGDVGNMV